MMFNKKKVLVPTVVGVGSDIVEIKRIKRFIDRKKDFLSRVFTDEELKYCIGKKNQYERLAVRFAAKEAVWKAVGLKGLALKDIGIVKSSGGKPGIVCKDERAKDFHFHISLSHSEEYASAVAVATKNIALEV
jgi:holo-[acyl-carrier protein] synthase